MVADTTMRTKSLRTVLPDAGAAPPAGKPSVSFTATPLAAAEIYDDGGIGSHPMAPVLVPL